MKSWWRKAFGQGVYPLKSLSDSAPFRARTRQEAAFAFRALRLKAGSELLDLCCGVGRHAIPLARAGVRVTGLDFSERYLAEARRAARAAGAPLSLVRRDMRRPGFKDRFDAAHNLFTSFGYFTAPTDDDRVLRGVRDALKPGGLFLLDTINGGRLEYILRWQETMGLSGERWAELPDGSFVLEEPELTDRGRAVTTRWVFLHGGRRREMTSHIRLYTGKRLARRLERAGLEVLRTFGEMSETPYSERFSPRLVVLARRRR